MCVFVRVCVCVCVCVCPCLVVFFVVIFPYFLSVYLFVQFRGVLLTIQLQYSGFNTFSPHFLML